MQLRGKSKDGTRKVTPPGPVAFSNDQFANYLADLRNTRISRPTGARPLPPSNRRESDRGLASTPNEAPLPFSRPSLDGTTRSASSMSHRRAQSSLSTYSSVTSRSGRQLVQQPTRDTSRSPERPLLKPSEVVPSATYIERGDRWMAKEEAVSLRDAMDDMEALKLEEEERLHAAAQEEASELVWNHQNPGQAINPNAPYGYKDHLRKNSYQHARTQSVGRYGEMTTGLARDIPRSISVGSSGSAGALSPTSRSSSEMERNFGQDGTARGSTDSSRPGMGSTSQKSYGSITNSKQARGSSRRRSSAKRNISGEVHGTFTGEQIWEEPEQEHQERGRSTEVQDMPAPLRIKPRNPLNRVQFVETEEMARSASTPPEPTKKLSRFEIYRNPPSQSRNPAYTANPPPAKTKEVATPEANTKDGLEIRSDEIRSATSMLLKDRSPKLPTPTAVSDKPGRPIVSFDANWKPAEADMKSEEKERRQPRNPFQRKLKQGVPARSDSTDVPPAIQLPDAIHVNRVNTVPSISIPSIALPPPEPSVPVVKPPVPTINFPNARPSVPSINFPDSPSVPQTRPSVPTINFPDSPSVPTINFPDSSPSIPQINLPDSHPSVPTIHLHEGPSISISAPDAPQIKSQRPLPDPKTAGGRPPPRHHATAPVPRGHWSPATGRRATATCHQCRMPIEGRVVGLRGAPEKYHPECFICFTCGTGLEALEVFEEPPAKRSERLDRIKRRERGKHLPEMDGLSMAEDGDPRLRYFCHLDWHEIYAPKCKHCKTSILGEHMIALGEHWHFGHFFCAECGDPFEKGMSHIEKDGYAWCVNCQTKRTERRAPKCKKCRLPVIGEAVLAMDGEWHDKCFRCANCKGDFPDGSFFPKEVGGATIVVCRPCMEMELKA